MGCKSGGTAAVEMEREEVVDRCTGELVCEARGKEVELSFGHRAHPSLLPDLLLGVSPSRITLQGPSPVHPGRLLADGHLSARTADRDVDQVAGTRAHEMRAILAITTRRTGDLYLSVPI